MKSLNTELQTFRSNEDRLEYMFGVFKRVRAKVSDILLFGPCNTEKAEQASSVYAARKDKRNNFHSYPYKQGEIKYIPAVIANSLALKEGFKTFDSKSDQFMDYLRQAYLYGTGTCEMFAIVGAYFLAMEYQVNLSIETIYSNQSHTYIRVHTKPEFLIDFWGKMVCEYDDTLSWNEVFGLDYPRNSFATFKTDIQLSNHQLHTMGEAVFNKKNGILRKINLTDVLRAAEVEISSCKFVVQGKENLIQGVDFTL